VLLQFNTRTFILQPSTAEDYQSSNILRDEFAVVEANESWVIFYFRVPYSQQYLFNAIPDITITLTLLTLTVTVRVTLEVLGLG